MIEHKKKGIPGSKGEEIFKQNVFTQLLNCASKNNIKCWFVLKRNIKKSFPSCLDSVSSLTVYINSKVLESDSFNFTETLLLKLKY